ncbi:sugar ABC transporter ATPase [Pseudomonas sp. HR96]|uniref:sugar ABC transporter ATPase n=1 Tax=Pseudomonas sp. HR96 TaxID=1027966 RepID=UPI002A754825|nr:sugar ABC transporter ATPase [Pseudomonas sp. HR96]WPP00849.1 sugar ABC transporter ATPase [Pseudomonas sp. HR96]
MQTQAIIAPRISTLPVHEPRARAILRWLVRKDIIEEQPSTCGASGNRMAYAISAGARAVVERPELLPFGDVVNGLEVITDRCICTPQDGFLQEAGCPQCRREVGEALFDSLEEWMPGHTDNFACPECGHEDDINGFIFLQPCAFSNLGFIFNNWERAGLKKAFVAEFADWLDQPVAHVSVYMNSR